MFRILMLIIVITKLVERKINYHYLIGYLEKLLILPRKSFTVAKN